MIIGNSKFYQNLSKPLKTSKTHEKTRFLQEIPKFLKNDNWAENWVIRVRSARESGYKEISMRWGPWRGPFGQKLPEKNEKNK